MNTIPTAEELLNNNKHKKSTEESLIEFAKLHVQEALKAAQTEAQITNSIAFKSILTSYVLTNIK